MTKRKLQISRWTQVQNIKGDWIDALAVIATNLTPEEVTNGLAGVDQPENFVVTEWGDIGLDGTPEHEEMWTGDQWLAENESIYLNKHVVTAQDAKPGMIIEWQGRPHEIIIADHDHLGPSGIPLPPRQIVWLWVVDAQGNVSETGWHFADDELTLISDTPINPPGHLDPNQWALIKKLSESFNHDFDERAKFFKEMLRRISR